MISSISSKLSQLTPVVEAIKLGNRIATTISSTARSTVSFTDVAIHQVPDPIKRGFGATKLLGVLTIAFSIPTLFHEMHQTFMATTLGERVKNAFKSVGTSSSMAISTISVLTGGRDIGLIASSAISWTALAMQVLFPFMVLGVGISAYELGEAIPDYTLLKKRILVSKKGDSEERRIQNITHTCYAVLENKEIFEKRLKLDSDLKIDEKARAVLRALHEKKPEALENGEAFSRTLNRRINTRIGLDLSNLVTKVCGTATSGAMIFSGPNPVVLGVGLAVSVASLATLGTELLLLNKDPFKGPGERWYQKGIYHVRESIFKTHDAIAECASSAFEKIQEGARSSNFGSRIGAFIR